MYLIKISIIPHTALKYFIRIFKTFSLNIFKAYSFKVFITFSYNSITNHQKHNLTAEGYLGGRWVIVQRWIVTNILKILSFSKCRTTVPDPSMETSYFLITFYVIPTDIVIN